MSHSSPDLSHLQSSLPHVPAEALSQLAYGEIDVLVGLNFNELQPDVENIHRDKVGGIIALKSIFGCGYVLGGHHDGITSNPQISPVAALVRVAKLKIVPEPSFTPDVEIRISLRFDKKYFARYHFRFVIFSLV